MPSCRWISPSRSSTSPLPSYFKPRFRRTFPSSSLSEPSADLHVLSEQFPCSCMCISAPSTTVTTQHRLYFRGEEGGGGQDELLGTDHCGDCILMATNFLYRAIKRLTLPLTHPLIYTPWDITKEESLWDTAMLWPVSAYVHVKWAHCSSTGEGQTILPSCSLSSGANSCVWITLD